MKRKKLLKILSDFMDGEGRKKRTHRAELKTLLIKLRKKEVELKDKLLAEKDERKHKRLEKELEIVKAQTDKGEEALQALE